MNKKVYNNYSGTSGDAGIAWGELLFSTVFMLPIVTGFLAEIMNLFDLSFPTGISYVIIYAFAFASWIFSLIKSPGTTIVILFISLFAILFSYLVTPEINTYIFNFGNGGIYELGQNTLIAFYGLCLPSFALCFCGMSFEKIYRYVYKYGLITSLLFILLMILQIFFISKKLNYMTVAYNSLPGIAIMFFDSKETHRMKSTLACIFGFAGILLGGCRGALLTLTVLIVLWEIHSLKNITPIKLFILIIGLILIVLFLNDLNSIAVNIDNFLNKFGYSSRIVEKFLGTSADGDFFIYSDREAIQQVVINKLGFWAHGLYADRIITDGSYPHNFILEILYQFGYLFGIPLLLIFIRFLFASYKAAKAVKGNFPIFSWVLFLCTVCVKLMLSASYLTDRPFWALLGLSCIALTNKNEIKDISNDEKII